MLRNGVRGNSTFEKAAAEGEVVSVLANSGRPMTPAEVACALGINGSTVRSRLCRMNRRGSLVSVGGFYSLPGAMK